MYLNVKVMFPGILLAIMDIDKVVWLLFFKYKVVMTMENCVHSKKITEPMLSNWILHQWHIH